MKTLVAALCGVIALTGTSFAGDWELYDKAMTKLRGGKGTEASWIVHRIKDQDVLPSACAALVQFGQPFNGAYCARRIEDNGERYEISKMLAKNNPGRCRDVLRGMPIVYRLLGARDMKNGRNPANAREEFLDVASMVNDPYFWGYE